METYVLMNEAECYAIIFWSNYQLSLKDFKALIEFLKSCAGMPDTSYGCKYYFFIEFYWS